MARYIDADKLLAELQEELEFDTPMYTEKENECFNSGVKCAIRDIKRLPTADVAEVKHGEWVTKVWKTECDWGDLKHRSITCSVCKGEIYNGSITNFCPNCGAKMDGGKV